MKRERAAFVEFVMSAEFGGYQLDFAYSDDSPFGADDGTKADTTDNCKSEARS